MGVKKSGGRDLKIWVFFVQNLWLLGAAPPGSGFRFEAILLYFLWTKIIIMMNYIALRLFNPAYLLIVQYFNNDFYQRYSMDVMQNKNYKNY